MTSFDDEDFDDNDIKYFRNKMFSVFAMPEPPFYQKAEKPMAFNDGRCAKCGCRIGWQGNITDKPSCSKCGHKPTAEEISDLQKDEEQLNKARAEVLKKLEKRRDLLS